MPSKARFQALRGASVPLETGIFCIFKMFPARCASPGPATRRDEGHRAEVERRTTDLDRPSHLTPHWARLGPGDGARHARPTSTEGFAPGFAPVCTRVCTRWPLTGFKPGGVSGTLAPELEDSSERRQARLGPPHRVEAYDCRRTRCAPRGRLVDCPVRPLPDHHRPRTPLHDPRLGRSRVPTSSEYE